MRFKSSRMMGVAVLVCALLLALAAVGFSQGPGGGGPRGPRGGGHKGPGGHMEPGGHGGPGVGVLGPFAREINLTDEQRAKIKELTDSFEASTKELRDRMHSLRPAEFGAASGEFNEAAVRAAAQQRASVQVELEVAHARLASQIFGVLTAEQKARLSELRQQFEQRRQQWESERGQTPGNRP